MALHVEIAIIQTIDCMASRKKLKFHPVPLTQYLFATVIKMLLPQYAKILSTGLLRLMVAGAMVSVSLSVSLSREDGRLGARVGDTAQRGQITNG